MVLCDSKAGKWEKGGAGHSYMEMRLKVLIVDDELPIRRELGSMDLEDHGFEIVGEAANGETALKLCRQLQPDIVITDITMPVMDGLTLIENLQKFMPLVKYILLTCHQDFAYARHAIEYNAVDYILKTDISEAEIVKSLDKARKIIQREREYLKKLEGEERNRFCRYAVHDMTNEKGIGLELEKIDFRINHNGPNYFLMVENRLGSWIFVEALVRGFLDTSEMIRSWILLKDGLYGICLESGADAGKLVSRMREEIRQIFPYVDQQFRIYAVESDNRILSGKQYLEESRMADRWKAYAFYNPQMDCLRNSAISDFFHYVPEHRMQLEALFQEKLDTREKLGQKVREWCGKAHLWPDELKRAFIDFSDGRKESGKETRRKENEDLSDACDISLLTESFVNQCYSELCFANRNEVNKTIRIIQTEYDKNLTLAEIGDRIGINPQYLGRLFAEETKEKFSDYLNRVRMEHADGLLKEGKLKIYEVAERVGITNYRYFTQKFREWSGVSPRQIRRGGKRDDRGH